MSRIVRFFLVFAVLLSAAALTFAQVDPTKALLGTWEGHASVMISSTQRTLIINSVTPKGPGEWVARGRFGITGAVKEGPGGQEISVTSKDNDIFVEFVAPGGGRIPVKLKLVGDKKLEGTMGLIERGRGVDRRITLEKVLPNTGDSK
jgi:hypothetical protein